MPKWRLSVPKNTKWWDFVNFCLRCCQETEIQHGNRPLHLTQHRHCLSMCQEWNDVRSDGSRRSKGLLAADSWSTESEFLHSDCLENLQSWGDFLLILWTTLGSCSRSEEMTFPSHSSSQVQNGGSAEVQLSSAEVHYCSRCCVFELHKRYRWDCAVHLCDFTIKDAFSVLSQSVHVLYNRKPKCIYTRLWNHCFISRKL